MLALGGAIGATAYFAIKQMSAKGEKSDKSTKGATNLDGSQFTPSSGYESNTTNLDRALQDNVLEKED